MKRERRSLRNDASPLGPLERATAEAGDDGEAARQLTRWSWGMRLILVLLLVATWDMVFKPGL